MKWNEITIWIHIYPNSKTYFNSKIGNKRSFSFETKASLSLIPTRRMRLWFQEWRERGLLCESMFIPIERCTSILKLVIRKVFIMKPKHQYLQSQRGERVYDAHSWNETRLLYESMFIPIERRTSILKLVTREVFLLKPKHQYH